MNNLKSPVVLVAIAAALLIGAAYGPKIPVVGTLAKKLPGAA